MWGICLKSYEKESFIKSFTLFFSVQIIFLSIVIYQDYKKLAHEYEMMIGNQIMQCHLKNNCKNFNTQLISNIHNKDMHTLYNENEIYMLFKFNTQIKKIFVSREEYIKEKTNIQKEAFMKYSAYLILLMFVSLFFALYAIRPLKQALKINEEFVKDILHDFNTPLAALNINYKILKKKFGKDDALQRSEEAIQNILSLQTNLHFFLSQSKLQNDTINIENIIKQRVAYFQTIFPLLKFYTQLDSLTININENAFVRIIDNLLSNAGKYNKEDGFVKVSLDKSILKIEDSGQGIENPQKIFNRYYKESDTGIGIGLHIVKKLCDELHISLNLETRLGEGSIFSLDLSESITSR